MRQNVVLELVAWMAFLPLDDMDAAAELLQARCPGALAGRKPSLSDGRSARYRRESVSTAEPHRSINVLGSASCVAGGLGAITAHCGHL